MKASDAFATLVVSLVVAAILTILTLTGLRLDDEAQSIQRATWHIAE